jgi:hypothetical protein
MRPFFAQELLDCFEQTPGHHRNACFGDWGAAGTRLHEYRLAARAKPGLNVLQTVTDNVRLDQIDLEIAGRLQKQPGTRLSAAAGNPEFRHYGIRMVETVIDAVEVAARLCETRLQALRELSQDPGCALAFRHPRLVGDKDGQPSGLIQKADSPFGARQKPEFGH